LRIEEKMRMSCWGVWSSSPVHNAIGKVLFGEEVKAWVSTWGEKGLQVTWGWPICLK